MCLSCAGMIFLGNVSGVRTRWSRLSEVNIPLQRPRPRHSNTVKQPNTIPHERIHCGWGRILVLIFALQKNRGRRTKTAPPAPAKGRTEQHLADAPMRGRGSSTASVLGLAAQFGGFGGSSYLTLTRQSKMSAGPRVGPLALQWNSDKCVVCSGKSTLAGRKSRGKLPRASKNLENFCESVDLQEILQNGLRSTGVITCWLANAGRPQPNTNRKPNDGDQEAKRKTGTSISTDGRAANERCGPGSPSPRASRSGGPR